MLNAVMEELEDPFEENIQTGLERDKKGQLTGRRPGPGRPKGSVNKTTSRQKVFAARVLGVPGTPEFEEFIASTRKQLLNGFLPPGIFALILHYAYGKPKETIEVQGEVTIEKIVREVVHVSTEGFREVNPLSTEDNSLDAIH